jgi:hypothetical protein
MTRSVHPFVVTISCGAVFAWSVRYWRREKASA